MLLFDESGGNSMCEFTTGVLYPRKYETKVLHQLPKSRQPYFHKNVNDEWLQLSSQHVPLLWFHDAEDSGWGFRLFDGGYEVSSATISYSLDAELAEAEFARLYPHINISEETDEDEEIRDAYEEILDTVVHSEHFRQEVRKGISRFRPQCFARFVGQKQINQLRSLFDIHQLTDFDEETGGALLYDSVDLFKEILGIEEMVWVNYAYLASGGREQ
jgi:hypothetical protein